MFLAMVGVASAGDPVVTVKGMDEAHAGAIRSAATAFLPTFRRRSGDMICPDPVREMRFVYDPSDQTTDVVAYLRVPMNSPRWAGGRRALNVQCQSAVAAIACETWRGIPWVRVFTPLTNGHIETDYGCASSFALMPVTGLWVHRDGAPNSIRIPLLPGSGSVLVFLPGPESMPDGSQSPGAVIEKTIGAPTGVR